MRLGEPLDPALQAATVALSRQAQHHASRFASIELRSQSNNRHLAPLGYLFAGLSGFAVVVTLWFL
jgi:hypothetical protein